MSREADAVRPQAYRLLSRLFLRGVTAPDLPLLAEVPDLAEHLPEPFDPDLAAAEHHRLFDQEVLPYASVFLEADGNLGGDVTAAVGHRFGSAGLALPPSEPPDHLGRELELLARLEDQREGGAPASGNDGQDGEVRAFTEGHLLWWLPSLVPAVHRNGSRFWGAVSGLCLDLVLEHHSAVIGEGPSDPPVPWNLQDVPRDPLDDPTVDLREVATFLMLPARSGLYLSEADARALGRTRRLPGGFGGRVRVLETVFHSAVAYEGMEDVTRGLGALADEVGRALDARVEQGLPPGFVEPWAHRLERTGAMLARMRRGEGPVA